MVKNSVKSATKGIHWTHVSSLRSSWPSCIDFVFSLIFFYLVFYLQNFKQKMHVFCAWSFHTFYGSHFLLNACLWSLYHCLTVNIYTNSPDTISTYLFSISSHYSYQLNYRTVQICYLLSPWSICEWEPLGKLSYASYYVFAVYFAIFYMYLVMVIWIADCALQYFISCLHI